MPPDGARRAADPAPLAALLTGPAVDTAKLFDAATTLLELGFLRQWGNQSAPASSVADYQSALDAARAGQPEASLRHLERAILAHPSHAVGATSDPAFDSIRGPVLQMLAQLTRAAHFRAEASVALAASSLPADRLDAAPARACLEVARAFLHVPSYEAYVRADLAAIVACQLATPAGPRPRPRRRAATAGFQPARAVLRLWRKLPLLAILLVWFAAGVAAGLASLLFAGAAASAWRDDIFPIWGLGLLGMVALGFIRSILRLDRVKPAR